MHEGCGWPVAHSAFAWQPDVCDIGAAGAATSAGAWAKAVPIANKLVHSDINTLEMKWDPDQSIKLR